MTQQEKEKMFRYLNNALVEFWLKQHKPDKEVRIELLERILNRYKNIANVALDEQSKEPVSDDLDEAARDYTDGSDWQLGENLEHIDAAFKAGAEWQKEQMLKEGLPKWKKSEYCHPSYGIVTGDDGWDYLVNRNYKIQIAALNLLPKEDKK